MGTLGDLLTHELDAKRQIELLLGPLLKLADQTYSLFERAIDAVAQYPRPGAVTVAATKVHMILAVRLANDFRVCCIASRLGYGLQAMGLTATMAEVLGTLSYVGDDEVRAREWAEHANRRATYPPRVKDGINAALTALNITEPDARDHWEKLYASLCMAKHANPMLSMEQGLRIFPDGAYFAHCGPDSTQVGAKNSCFALYHAVQFGLEAISVFAKSCSDEGLQAQLRNDALKLELQVDDLEPLVAAILEPPSTKPS